MLENYLFMSKSLNHYQYKSLYNRRLHLARHVRGMEDEPAEKFFIVTSPKF